VRSRSNAQGGNSDCESDKLNISGLGFQDSNREQFHKSQDIQFVEESPEVYRMSRPVRKINIISSRNVKKKFSQTRHGFPELRKI